MLFQDTKQSWVGTTKFIRSEIKMTKEQLIQVRVQQMQQAINDHYQTLFAVQTETTPDNQNVQTGQFVVENDVDIALVLKSTTEVSHPHCTNMQWLAEFQHIAWEFRRSPVHFRFLFSDGIFCDLCFVDNQNQPTSTEHHEFSLFNAKNKHQDKDWILNEFFCNLLIGLRRFNKGDKLSAFFLIQQRALSGLLALVTEQTQQQKHSKSGNNAPHSVTSLLKDFASGYEYSPGSAYAMLQYIELYRDINYFLKDQILNLISSHSSLH